MKAQTKQRLRGGIIVLVILAVALGIARYFVATKPEARKRKPAEMVTLVNVMTVTPTNDRVVVEAMGTVQPVEQITLQPEVSGRVTWKNEALIPGGRVDKGEVLVRIDAREYEYAVEQQRASVKNAAVQLEQERARKSVAEEEWSLLGDEVPSSETGRSLALREPQLKAAEASLTAAENALARSELNVERTVLRAPFNALVLDEFVDPGQLIGTQTTVARLAGTDAFWVQVSVPVAELGFIDVPSPDNGGGSPARVIHDTGAGQPVVRSGEVIRLLGDLEPQGRMARVLVEVPDPLHENGTTPEAHLPLLLGAYVSVEITGRELEDVYIIPRTALREGETVWVMNDEDRLEIREVSVAWERGDIVEIETGLEAGERVVTTRIPIPIPDMLLTLPGTTSEDTNKHKKGPKPVGQTE
jgi:RND family efflux transporter MFP subunit